MMKTTKEVSVPGEPPHYGTITQAYPRLAFSSAVTPATPEHYADLRRAGIDTVSVCLHLSGYNHYKFATIHTQLARNAGMCTHAFMVTDLRNPMEDVQAFTTRFTQLAYGNGSKITIWVTSNKYVDNREEKIVKIIQLLSRYHSRENIDVAFYKRDLDAKIYDLSKLPRMLNLTIVNYDAISTGIDVAGTWIYTSNFCNSTQALAYDYYGYYTDNASYQLSLVDTDYVVQRGDTWISIARRHGIPVLDLLTINRATADDRVFEGQIVRIA